MTAALSITPESLHPGDSATVSGTGFPILSTRIRQGTDITPKFRPRPDGSFDSVITASGAVIYADQYSGGRWNVVARLAPLLTFQPPVVDVTPPVVTGVTANNITNSSALISWVTNEPSNSQVDYGTTTGYLSGPTVADPAYVTAHAQTLTGLSATTLYHYRVRSIDRYGNSTVGVDLTFTTLTSGTDTTAPVISNVVTSTTSTTATVSWDLSEVATGQFDYGLTTSYGSSSALESSFIYTHHSMTVTSLTPGATYHYRIRSVDPSGNVGLTTDATFTTAATAGGFPVDQALTFRTRPTIPSLPGYLVKTAEPTWGTQYVRATNTPSRRHFYARYQAWNFDSTLIYLDPPGVYPGRMIDGTTYADIGSFSGLSNGFWCNTENRMYGVDGGGANLLYQQTVTSAGALIGTTVKHTFGVGYTAWIGGNSASWEGGISDDDRFICITLTDVTHGGGDRLQVYDTVLDTIVGDIAKPASVDNAMMSRSGTYVVVVRNGSGTYRYNQDLTNATLLTTSSNHCDVGYDASGNDIVVANNAPGVVSYRLSTASPTTLLAAGSAFEYGHVSGHHSRNGWMYLSIYDSTSTAGRAGFDQVVALKTDGSGTVNVFGFSNNATGGGTYNAQPHASASRDGKRVIVASAWGLTDVYDYVYGLTV